MRGAHGEICSRGRFRGIPERDFSDQNLLAKSEKELARQRKLENELKKTEEEIEKLESRDQEIDETLVLPEVCTDVAKCLKLSKEKEQIAEKLEELYERWEELAQ